MRHLCWGVLLCMALACAPLSTPSAPTREPAPRATPIRFPTATPDLAALTPSPTATLVVRATPTLPGTAGPQPTATPAPARLNPLGVLFAESLNIERRVALLKTLGAAYLRPADVNVQEWRGACAECAAIEAAGMKVVLSVRASGSAQTPSAPPADLGAYTRVLDDILATRRPAVLIVEQEQNLLTAYAGTSAQYGTQMRVACETAQRRGIACANGGISSSEVLLLVWADYIERGLAGNACSFARRTLEPVQAQQWCNARTSGDLPSATQEALKRAREMLLVLNGTRADYVNFHWNSADPVALEETVRYLQSKTSLPAICDEMGLPAENASGVQTLLRSSLELGMPLVVWASVDSPKARALTNADGSLRANGEAFRAFAQARFK